jgi:DNA mismatch endonuclease (patch repair protein)
MPDFLTPEQRSHRMSLIRSKDTKPELAMARVLDDAKVGYSRYPELPGTPDFLVGHVALFVNGEFWHGRHLRDWQHKLKPFWLNKIRNNIRRDKRVDRKLRRLGFSIVRVWAKDVRRAATCLARIGRAQVSRRSCCNARH